MSGKTFAELRESGHGNLYTLLQSINDLDELENIYEAEYNRANSGTGLVWLPNITEKQHIILDRILELEPVSYREPLVISGEETINGYKLNETSSDEEPIMWYSYFCKFPPLYTNGEDMSFETFKDRFNEIACTEWNKMDEHGESRGGFWKYPEGSLEREHAWDLTFDKNIRSLYKLPYSKEFILLTVEIGCNNRLESVRYSNFICEWVRRKREQMNV